MINLMTALFLTLFQNMQDIPNGQNILPQVGIILHGVVDNRNPISKAI